MTTANLRDTRRITEHDADFRRLHQQTVTALRGSLRQFARDLRTMPTADAQHAFITRHTDILRQAYYDAHQAGSNDFDGLHLHHSQANTHALLPRSARLTRVLSFYLPSVAKMATEGAAAYQQSQRQTFDEPASPYDDPANAYQTYPYRQSDPLNDWSGSDDLSNRVTLQGNVVWPAMQDGYVDAGVADGRYTKLAWELEPLAMHCSDCPEMAAGSPYDAPGSGGNELWTTPGDGNTMCGANCRCSLRYVDAGGGALGVDESPAPSMPQDGANLANVLPASMPSLDKLDGDFTVSMPNRSTYTTNQRQARNAVQAALRAWDRVRGDLPSIDPFDPEASLDLPEWDELTDEQQEALEDFLNGIISWNVATNLANLDDLSLAELVATWRFYSPDQQRVPKGAPGAGRFQDEGKGRRATGGTHAVQGYGRQEHSISEMPRGQSRDMEAWLNQHRADQEWHVADVHPAILHDVATTLDRMKALYPDAHYRLEKVTTDGDWEQHPHAYAYVDHQGREMHLNPRVLGDKDAFEAKFNGERASGWQANGQGLTAAQQLTVHEFGHVVDDEMNATHDAFEPVVSSTGLGRVDSTWAKMQTAMIGRLTGAVSRYAQKDHWELFSEAFVMLHASNRLPDKQGEMIDRLRTFLTLAYHVRYPRGNYKGMAELTPEERIAGEHRLRMLAEQLNLYYP